MIEVRKQLYEMCDKTNTSRSGMDHLVNYYIKSLESCKKSVYFQAAWPPLNHLSNPIESFSSSLNSIMNFAGLALRL